MQFLQTQAPSRVTSSSTLLALPEMAVSKVYKINTIFQRATALIESGVLSPQKKPLWYDIYQRFPPYYDPYFSRPAPDMEVRHIFYEEDEIRAVVHETISKRGFIDLTQDLKNTKTKYFIRKCNEVMKKNKISIKEAFQQVLKESSDGAEKK